MAHAVWLAFSNLFGRSKSLRFGSRECKWGSECILNIDRGQRRAVLNGQWETRGFPYSLTWRSLYSSKTFKLCVVPKRINNARENDIHIIYVFLGILLFTIFFPRNYKITLSLQLCFFSLVLLQSASIRLEYHRFSLVP